MKKMLKKIFCLFLVVICTIIISQNKPTVIAKGENKKEECTKINGLDKYKPDVFPSYHSNGEVYTLSIKRGVFDVYVYEIQFNDQTGETWPVLRDKFGLGGKNSSIRQYVFTRANYPKSYDFVFNLIESDDMCKVDASAPPKRNNDGSWSPGTNLGYVFSHQVEVPAAIDDPYFTNIHYDGICSSLRTGDYDKFSQQFSKAGLSKEEFNNYRGRVLSDFSYCNNHLVTVSYKENEVATIIRNMIAGYKLGQMSIDGIIKGPSSIDSEIIPENGSTDFSTDDKALKCPAYQNINGNQLPNKSTTVKNYYKTMTTVKDMNIYTTHNDNAKCIKTCEENVKVTYGPPVASKAGLCFEYKVKVESELNCATEFTGLMPKPEEYTVCTPIGACNSMGFLSASGPNEDFDDCVNSCDGGKYTQKCIDSCYNDVYTDNYSTGLLPINYNKKLSTMANAVYNSKVSKLTTKEEEARYDDILKAIDNIGDGRKYTIDDLKSAIVEASTGYYYVKNGSIAWQSGNRYWEKPGRYYTLNIISFTVSRLKTAGGNYWNNIWNQGGLSIVDNNGFLRNNSGGSGYCTADCNWYGCTNARSNTYYNGYPNNPGTPSNREFLNSADAVSVYMDDFKRYENAYKECKASAACTSKTSEFTIKVNNKTKTDPDKDNWIDYATSITESGHETATTVNGKAFSDDTTIILDKDGCYNQEKPRGNAYYMTEWSFPGTWVNNKTGKISYQPIGGNAWHLKKEKFCTNLDSKYVNTAWWNQRILQPNTPVDDASKATIEDYNIEATTKNFGYYGWNFKIKCFYALYDSPIPGEPSNNDEDTKPLSYKLRPVDLNDIFPNNDNENITTDPNETGRAPGYNWTDEATNVKNIDYEVTPGALYSIIQARGNEIYDTDKQSAYLDYEFYLTPSDLNKIRRYSTQEADGNYNTYPGKIKVANGIAYYESALFRSSSKSTYKLGPDSIKTLGALGVNNQKRKDSNESETFGNSDSYISSLRTSRDEYFKNLLGGNK